MRIPKRGNKSAAPPPAQTNKSSKAEQKAPGRRAARTLDATFAEGQEPLALSDELYDRLFRNKGAKGPAPARRTTARVQRAFADAFLDEAAPAHTPPPHKK